MNCVVYSFSSVIQCWHRKNGSSHRHGNCDVHDRGQSTDPHVGHRTTDERPKSNAYSNICKYEINARSCINAYFANFRGNVDDFFV